jgi:ATP-dependent DNA ligase
VIRRDFTCCIACWEIDEAGVFGALLLGYYDDDAGELTYAGRCGGFSDKVAVDILRKLILIEATNIPIPAFLKDGGRGERSSFRPIHIG